MGTIIILFLIGATPFLLLCLLAYFLINVGKTKRIRKQQEESDVMAQRIGHYTAKEMCNTNESEKEEIIMPKVPLTNYEKTIETQMQIIMNMTEQLGKAQEHIESLEKLINHYCSSEKQEKQ